MTLHVYLGMVLVKCLSIPGKNLSLLINVIVCYSLSKEECERALLPTLEHASLVHSHIHHPSNDIATTSPDTFAQTRNAIIYISVSMTI